MSNAEVNPRVCKCFDQTRHIARQRTPVIHAERQDTSSKAWAHVCERIESTIRSGERDFSPLAELNAAERAEIITLPASIGGLVEVQRLFLYGSYLVRIPPEIGAMRALVELDVYTSYKLHFLPYELTRCSNLRDSCVSTRALFGNHKHRSPFPDLSHDDNAPALSLLKPSTCSVCSSPLPEPSLCRWITLRRGTDWFPLLVNACSTACVEALPPPAEGYCPHPHTGGAKLTQPPPDH